ncbi:MAG: Uma2 family endonuclease [bacterium]
MAMPAVAKFWSQEEVREMQGSRAWPRYELIDGELLVTSSPSVPHQRFIVELLVLIRAYVIAHDVGEVLTSPADIELDQGSVLQPDIFVIPPGLVVRTWPDVTALLLAIEVLSPSTARHDRVTKRIFFQKHRVPEYWIVDLEARLVERWRPDDVRPEILPDRLIWQPYAGVEPLTIDLTALFVNANRA